MKYAFAEAVTTGKPIQVMKSDAKSRKNCFLVIDEIPMTEIEARMLASRLNAELKK